MGKIIDYTPYVGQKFGMLRITSVGNPANRWDGRNRATLNWACDCGKTGNTAAYEIISGHSTSCGCYRYIRVRQKNTKHGQSYNPIYQVWAGMVERCRNPNCIGYYNYGGRGIKVCDEWINNSSAFIKWALENGYSPGLELDREDNNGDYSPKNCRFVTRLQNSRNKRTSHFIEYKGQRKTISEWCEILSLGYSIIFRRLQRGWTVELALGKPENYKLKNIERVACGLKPQFPPRKPKRQQAA